MIMTRNPASHDGAEPTVEAKTKSEIRASTSTFPGRQSTRNIIETSLPAGDLSDVSSLAHWHWHVTITGMMPPTMAAPRLSATVKRALRLARMRRLGSTLECAWDVTSRRRPARASAFSFLLSFISFPGFRIRRQGSKACASMTIVRNLAEPTMPKPLQRLTYRSTGS